MNFNDLLIEQNKGSIIRNEGDFTLIHKEHSNMRWWHPTQAVGHYWMYISCTFYVGIEYKIEIMETSNFFCEDVTETKIIDGGDVKKFLISNENPIDRKFEQISLGF